MMQPRARQEDLLIQPVGDELVIYDRKLQQAHHLNRAAALVWRRCDGRTSIPAIAQLVASDLRVAADEPAIWLALARLERAHLLQEETQPAAARPDVSRREVLRRLGASGAVLLPVITSIAAPTVAMAASGTSTKGDRGAACTDGSQCKTGICIYPTPGAADGTCA